MGTLPEWTRLSWRRRVLPLGEIPVLDRYGWPLSGGAVDRSLGLEDQREVPVVVVRGERGLGKSVAMEQECAALREQGLPVAWVDLGRCVDASVAEEELARAFRRPREGEGAWYVILDGLDEGLNEYPALDVKLAGHVERLGAEGRRGLRLRISSRTARWPARLEDRLRRLWEPQEVAVVGLAPLSREDVALAARTMGVADAEALIVQVQRRGLIALATSPITLRQLLRGYTKNQALPLTADQAYREACLDLCTETRRPNAVQQLYAQAAPEDLLAIAARIAAVMQFGPYTALSDQAGSSEAHPGDLPLLSLSGVEQGHLGDSIACTTSELRQVTESGLLVPIDELRWVFAHRSYQEYLAAYFLRSRAVPRPVLRALLWIGDGRNRHLLQAHQEVAAWLAASGDAVFNDLLREDPFVLLLSDLSVRDPSDRGRAVTALMDAVEADDTLRLDYAQLHRLDHAGLAEQLRPRLAAITAPHLLSAAVSIAHACRRAEFNDSLLKIAEGADIDAGTRRAALEAVTDPGPAHLARLRALAEDPSPEVVATALEQLYPGHLTVTEFLWLFRDPEADHIGAAFMLRKAIPAGLDAATVGQAAAWARAVTSDPDCRASRVLAFAVLARAVTMVEDGAVPGTAIVPAVGEALLSLAANEDDLFSHQLQESLAELDAALTGAVHTRRHLALYVLAHADESQWAVLLGLPGTGLMPGQDVVHWMEHWEEIERLPEPAGQQITRYRPPQDPEELRRVRAAQAAHPSLAALTAWWDEPRPETPRQRAIREERARRAERNTYDESDLRRCLQAVHAVGAEGVRAAWQAVRGQLYRTADGSAVHTYEPLLMLADLAPSRPPAGSELDRQLAQAAVHVLRTAPAITAGDLAGSGADVWRTPELTAFAVAGDLASVPDDPDRCAGWALALATLHPYDAPSQRLWCRLLTRCTQAAADRIQAMLPAVLDAVTDHAAGLIARSLGGDTLHYRPVLRTWAQKTDDPQRWHAVLSELSVAGDTDATAQLVAALQEDPTANAQDTPVRQRWMLACGTLLHHDSLAGYWPAIRPRLDDATVLAHVLNDLARNTNTPYGWPQALKDLSEDDLADLYRLICAQDAFAALRTRPWRSGFIGGDDRLAELVRSLPEVLAMKETARAAAVLEDLARHDSDVPALRRLARVTGRAAAAAQATPVDAQQLMRLADNHGLRLVHDAHQLLEVVTESLQALQEDLQGDNGTAVNLWNRDSHRFLATTKCWPCWEDDLCDAVTAFLRRDIGARHIVINREVEIQRPTLPGQRTDIHIEAFPPHGSRQAPLRVIIECKGCWNDELEHAIPRQLAAYIEQRPHTAGLLLVGYFDCTRWNHNERGCPARDHAIEDITNAQNAHAARLQHRSAQPVQALVLDCRLPGPESDWRRSTAT